MSRPHMRPRLEVVVPATPDELRELLRARLDAPGSLVEGRMGKHHLHVQLVDEVRHRWSPTLDVSLRPTDDGTRLLGRFGPHPELWTLYLFLYAACAFVAVVAGCGVLAQLALDTPLTAAWGLVGAGVAAGAAWVSGRIGARWGHDQMVELYRIVDGLGSARVDEAHVTPPRGDHVVRERAPEPVSTASSSA